jgi:hypothetical protein
VPTLIHHANSELASCLPVPGILSDAEGPVVVTVRVDAMGAPFGVTLPGVNVHAADKGRPEHENVTGLLKPPTGLIVRVKVADWPAWIEAVVGLAVIVKSGGIPAFTVCVSGKDVLPVKFWSPLYIAVMECVPTARAEVL